jgi:hypothetical protein
MTAAMTRAASPAKILVIRDFIKIPIGAQLQGGVRALSSLYLQ